ncbi:MAG: DUF5622 domain-containing protein [Desulfurococcaceae archaeon]
MGLKHGKYIYVKRKDGWYVKIRVLNIRFAKKKQEIDISNPTRYIITGVKTKKPPLTATIISEEALPLPVQNALYGI